MLQGHRHGATNALVQFLLSVERGRRLQQEEAHPDQPPWPGYADPVMERLRQGIGPEDVALLQALRPSDQALAKEAGMRLEEVEELNQ